MKLYSLRLLLAVALCPICSHFAVAQTSVTNGLVAYYSLNGNGIDASGNGNNASAVYAVPTVDRYGNANGAFHFGGVSNYIAFTNVPLTQVDNWTMTAWIRATSTNQLGVAVSMGYNDPSQGNGYSLGISSGFGAATGDQLFGIFGSVGWINSGSTLPDTNQWHQVVMERTSGTTQFFIDGLNAPNKSTLTPITPSTFMIGSENGIRYFNGDIDDVRIYSRALSYGEVSQLYTDESFCSPHAAAAVPIVYNGFVVGATITDFGCGYTNTPLVYIEGGSGSGATGTAVVENGIVTGINITDPGCCYTNPPFIEIASPPFTPTLSIAVSRVNVTVHVTLGLNYVLDSSEDLISWTPTGPSFTATNEYMTTEFVVNQTGQYFRVRQVP